ncbi:MAG: hypothetical protein JXR48_04965 [Candidatus Delongbacteria bacterium]|nr:hypothetical protein [Candidatus Delongbacteria bacterium]MBN2834299.1 hypothetical protein [Candidatus Delongbacteria bacterium]
MKLFSLFLILMSGYAMTLFGQISENEKSMFISNVVVPLPSEIILALDNLTDVDWKNTVEYNYSADYEENYRIVLNLGIKVANGFVAIQAQDKKNIGEMFAVSKNLAENFGAKSNLFSRKEEIVNLVNENNWNELRKTLDDMQQKIKIEMAKYHPDFVTLASVGGWLQGLNVVTTALEKNYDEKASTILYQPVLINYFIRKLEGLDKKYADLDIIKTIATELKKVKELTDAGYGKPIALDKIKELKVISKNLVQAIEKEA